jgi:hypothetical protein
VFNKYDFQVRAKDLDRVGTELVGVNKGFFAEARFLSKD